MSTRSTIYYDNNCIHIYVELLDNSIHLEYEYGGALVDITIMTVEEWKSAGFPLKS